MPITSEKKIPSAIAIVALGGHLRILTHGPALIAERDRRDEDRQQHCDDDPGTHLHSDPTRRTAEPFRDGDSWNPSLKILFGLVLSGSLVPRRRSRRC